MGADGAFSSKKRCVNTMTHMDAGVIGQNAVVGEGDILLLPLFVERVPAALQQDALVEVTGWSEDVLLKTWVSMLSNLAAA